MGISRDSWHKRRATGGKKVPLRKKRKFELGRPAAGTKLGNKRIHKVRTRGGNIKYRAMRLDHGNFSWGSEAITRSCRILDVVYNASNNELVRTKTLVKNCIVHVDCIPFRQWYETHYGLPIGRKKTKKEPEILAGIKFGGLAPNDVLNVIHGFKQEPSEDDPVTKKRSKHVQRKLDSRRTNAKVDPHVEEQFLTGRVYACVASRPGQSGRCDGYILEGKELEFYQRKLRSKKAK